MAVVAEEVAEEVADTVAEEVAGVVPVAEARAVVDMAGAPAAAVEGTVAPAVEDAAALRAAGTMATRITISRGRLSRSSRRVPRPTSK